MAVVKCSYLLVIGLAQSQMCMFVRAENVLSLSLRQLRVVDKSNVVCNSLHRTECDSGEAGVISQALAVTGGRLQTWSSAVSLPRRTQSAKYRDTVLTDEAGARPGRPTSVKTSPRLPCHVRTLLFVMT